MKKFSLNFFKFFLKVIFISIFILAPFLSGCGGFGGTDTGNPKIDNNTGNGGNGQEICESAGGEWITFSDACVDSCSSQREKNVVCLQVITVGCECGEDRCWNAETLECEDI